MQVDYGVWNSKVLLATHENTVHKVLNVKILSLYRPSYLSEMFIRCSLTNGPTQTLTSQSKVGVNLNTIEGRHGKSLWLFKR
jgi:hypothetical protein